MEKPAEIAADEYASRKWDELTDAYTLTDKDVRNIILLIKWHKIADKATDELDSMGGDTAYQTDTGEIKQFPQIATLKMATDEIRQLEKLMNLSEREKNTKQNSKKADILTVVINDRKRKAANA